MFYSTECDVKKWESGKWQGNLRKAKLGNYTSVVFLCYEMFALKNLFSFLETRFYLFHGTRSLREVLGRYAPVTAAVALTLDRFRLELIGA